MEKHPPSLVSREASAASAAGSKDKSTAPTCDLPAHKVAAAIVDAPAGRCPRTGGLFALRVDVSPPLAVPVSCRTWDCPTCRGVKALVAFAVVSEGIARYQAKGERVRFLTLTDGEGSMTVPELYAAWNRFRQRMRRRDMLKDYALAVEVGSRLHLHACITGRFIDQARELVSHAEAAGFGRIADIRAVPPLARADTLAGYITRADKSADALQLARYLTKSTAQQLRERGAKRVRPLRVSREWEGGNLTEGWLRVRREWYGETEGKWEVVHASQYRPQLERLERMRLVASPPSLEDVATDLLAA